MAMYATVPCYNPSLHGPVYAWALCGGHCPNHCLHVFHLQEVRSLHGLASAVLNKLQATGADDQQEVAQKQQQQ